MPVAYAVTYLFGTAGSAWFLSSIGPKLLGVDLVKECKEYEEKLGGAAGEAGGLATYPMLVLRAYRIPSRLEVRGPETRASRDRPAHGGSASLGPAGAPRGRRDGMRAGHGGGGRRRPRLLRAARGAPGECVRPGQRGGRPRAARLPGGGRGRRGHPERGRGDDARGAGAEAWPGPVPEQGDPGRAGDAAQPGPQGGSW